MLLAAATGVVLAASREGTTATGSRQAGTSGVVLIAADGNDASCERGIDGPPCGSFERAYELAECGDEIRVAAGAYSDQRLIETERGSLCLRRPVVIEPERGAAVTINSLQAGETNVDATHAADNIVVRSLRVTRGVSAWGDAENWTLDRIDGGAFLVAGGATNWVIKNSDWGPCSSDGREGCGTWYWTDPGAQSAGQSWVRPGARNIVIVDNRIHDMAIVAAGHHFECMYIDGGTDITIRRNRFYNCETNAIAISGGSAQDGVPPDLHGTLLIENNWFGDGTPINGVIKFGDLPFPSDSKVIIRFNSFAKGYYSVYNEESGQPLAGQLHVIGNIIGTAAYWVCIPGANYDYNVFLNDGRNDNTGCGRNKRFMDAVPYVNPSPFGDMNYHLRGRPNGTRADNLVPDGTPMVGRPVDVDRQPRRAGWLFDAGSDERWRMCRTASKTKKSMKLVPCQK